MTEPEARLSSAGWPRPAAWIDAVKQSEVKTSAWPGPHPLTEEDGEIDFLVGREKDLDTFIERITYYRLTHLTGTSGVGKSSLLRAGIIPELTRRGYTVAYCRDWSNLTGNDFQEFLARQLHASLPAEKRDQFSANTDIFWELHDLNGDGVIILDQFEEIVRRGMASREELFAFLVDLHVHTSIPVVLSYRSEYVHVFRTLDRNMRVERTIVQEVEPVDPKAGLELIRRPRRPADAPDDWDYEQVITESAANAIHEDWSKAVAPDTQDRIPIGMLHLQAMLYSLSSRASGRIITLADYEDFTKEAGPDPAVQANVAEVMGLGLQESAQTRIELASRQAEAIGADIYLSRGIASTVADIVPQLSSGGFKLERDVVELATSMVADVRQAAAEYLLRELSAQLTPDQVSAILDRLVLAMTARHLENLSSDSAGSLLAAPGTEILARVCADLDPMDQELPLHDLLTRQGDPRDICCGPLLGLNPLAALVEQLRRIGWATIWLHELNLARLDSDGKTRATLTLVHDGLGEALKRWADRYDEVNQTQSLFALIAPEGKSHEWTNTLSQQDLCGVPGSPRIHVNPGFKGNSIIGASISHAVFVNGDFRGTLFYKCSFEGVTFLNCRVDGALFSDCEVKGAPTGKVEERAPDSTEAPFYLLEDPDGLIGPMLRRYRDDGGHGDLVLSQRPGMAAVATNDVTAGLRWEAPTSGLVVQGSKLSALTFRGTKFADDAALSFVRVRGSGLDIAELVTGRDDTHGPRIELRESLLRHVAFTAAVAEDHEIRKVRVSAFWSVLAQCWVGAGLTGHFEASDCMIGQLWVVDPESFEARCDAASVSTGLAGMAADPASRRLGVDDGAAMLDLAPAERLEGFRRSIGQTDYRRD